MSINDKGEIVFSSLDEFSNFVRYYSSYLLIEYRDFCIDLFKECFIKDGIIERRKKDD